MQYLNCYCLPCCAKVYAIVFLIFMLHHPFLFPCCKCYSSALLHSQRCTIELSGALRKRKLRWKWLFGTKDELYSRCMSKTNHQVAYYASIHNDYIMQNNIRFLLVKIWQGRLYRWSHNDNIIAPESHRPWKNVHAKVRVAILPWGYKWNSIQSLCKTIKNTNLYRDHSHFKVSCLW